MLKVERPMYVRYEVKNLFESRTKAYHLAEYIEKYHIFIDVMYKMIDTFLSVILKILKI